MLNIKSSPAPAKEREHQQARNFTRNVFTDYVHALIIQQCGNYLFGGLNMTRVKTSHSNLFLKQLNGMLIYDEHVSI